MLQPSLLFKHLFGIATILVCRYGSWACSAHPKSPDFELSSKLFCLKLLYFFLPASGNLAQPNHHKPTISRKRLPLSIVHIMFTGHHLTHMITQYAAASVPFRMTFYPIGPSVTAVSGLIILAGRETHGPNPKRKDASILNTYMNTLPINFFRRIPLMINSSNLVINSQTITNQLLFQNISKFKNINSQISSPIGFHSTNSPWISYFCVVLRCFECFCMFFHVFSGFHE